MGCVCVCLRCLRLYFILFLLFLFVFDFFFTFDVYLPSMFVSFAALLFWNHLYRCAVKWCNEGESVKKNKYLNKCDTLQFIGCTIYASAVLPFVGTSCSHIDEHVCVLLASLGGFGTVFVCCHARKERRHCTIICLGVCEVDCYSMRKTVSLHFFKWLTLTHSFSVIRK